VKTSLNRHAPRNIAAIAKELDGFLDLGMTVEARKLVREILRHPDLGAGEFADAVRAIGMDDRPQRWRPSIESAHKRLPKKEQRRARASMLAFYIAVNDTKAALPFCAARDLSAAPYLWFAMEALLEHGKAKEAKAVARKCAVLRRAAHTAFDQGCLSDALASYYIRRGDWARAHDACLIAPNWAMLPRSRAIRLVEFYLAAALKSIESGLYVTKELRRQTPVSLKVCFDGATEGLVKETEKNLMKFRRVLERLIPSKRRRALGLLTVSRS
jgi:hypothetical protein